jgi:leucyl/phenylalanyl-tRNA---protein transferase
MFRTIQFPDPSLAEDDGLLAVGGELSAEYLLAAYSRGIFPWFSEGEPILWWSPDPRMVLNPRQFKCSKSLRQKLNSKKFTVKLDTRFKSIIQKCARAKRKQQSGTWITADMIEAYCGLHKLGFAHSVETYLDKNLVGGLYGVSLGRAFFGESMFYEVTDASKIALDALCRLLSEWDFHFIDVQQSTGHLKSLGAEDIPREVFLSRLSEALKYPTKAGKWRIENQ